MKADARRREHLTDAIPWLVGAVALITYAPALRNGFAYDDVVIVARNVRIQHWSTLPQALGIAYWYTTGQLYRPLTTLTFGLEWLLGGGAPVVFHLVSALAHALVSALVARVALRWWSPAAALASGLFFAVHPVHVEAVANVVGQSELLCGAALLGLVLISGAAPPGEGDRSASAESSPPVFGRSGRALAVGLLSAMAVASKETGVAAPAIVWAAAWLAAWPGAGGGTHGRARDASGRRAVWHLVGASVIGVATMIALRVIVLGALAGDRPHPAFHEATGVRAVLLALATLPRAVALVLTPGRPAPDYSPTDDQIAHPDLALVACGVGLVGVGIAALVRHAARPSPWALAILFGAATLAPVANLAVHTGVILAERTLYSPSIGGVLMVGGSLTVLTRSGGRQRWPGPTLFFCRALLAFASVLLVVALTFAEQAIPMWHDTDAVIAAMQARVPDSYRGPALRARVLREAGNYPAAHASYSRAIALFSADPTVLHDAAATALVVGDTGSAIRWLTRGLAVDSTHLQIRTALVELYVHEGDSGEARALLVSGLRIAPDQRSWQALLTTLPRGPRAGRAPLPLRPLPPSPPPPLPLLPSPRAGPRAAG